MADKTEPSLITRETIADKIGLMELISEQPDKEQKILELYNIICDVLTTDNADKIRVAKKQLPAVTVKQEFLKLGKSHILYVMDCLEKNGENIRDNSKGYILTSLYNSLRTIEYYRLHDQSAFKNEGNSKSKVKSEYDISNFFRSKIGTPLKI